MYNFLVRRGTTIAFVVGFLISVIILILNFSGAKGILADDFETLYGVSQFTTTSAIGVFLVAAAIIIMIIGGAYGLIVNPKSALKFLIGFGVLAVLCLILYFGMGDNNTNEVRNLMEEEGISSTISKMINAGIFSTLALLGIALVTMILGELRNAFK